MSADIRKEGIPVFVDGQESRIQARAPRQDEAEGWSITTRPYRHRPEDALLDNLGSDSSCCCFLPGNRVTMADGSTRAIESIVAGDMVLTMTGPARVSARKTTRLGLTRKVIELRGIGDEVLFMTDDHPLWVSRQAQSGERRESWGTYNLHHLMYELRGSNDGNTLDAVVPLWFDLPEQVAHTSGWLHVRPVFHQVAAETEVFHLIVEGATSFVVEGFPVFSHSLHEQGKAGAWQGIRQDEQAVNFVSALSAATA
ncbi:Hint domain-containing protein [Piscinibacter terrae]|uniref:Hint domain-containing protein n=1 Tax=Piscinibacter terrae TaxID=2496871 RepID=A0A3N7HWG9_9BURK|nr:Hint domain-containing protein [Albitalea terrae]RQP26677.1 hypothetical protein DZC73_06690 [Albitalea terrae]